MAASAIGNVNQRIANMGSTIEKLKTKQKDALTSMEREALWGGDAVRKWAAEVDRLDKKIQDLSQVDAGVCVFISPVS